LAYDDHDHDHHDIADVHDHHDSADIYDYVADDDNDAAFDVRE
jgi:hypothetical protein